MTPLSKDKRLASHWYCASRYGALLLSTGFIFQGDLGAIDEKYDVAISSSCGALDNILVDTIDTAQKCVTFLKTQNIGVATFIGLDKVRVSDTCIEMERLDPRLQRVQR